MGYVQVYSGCVACFQPFFYNPISVPSVRVHGKREPICPTCLATINVRRVAAGLPPIVPLPGAYDACDEAELPDPGWE